MQDDVKRALDDVGEIKRVLRLTGDDFSGAGSLLFIAGLFWIAEGALTMANTFGIWLAPLDTTGRTAMLMSYISQGLSIAGFFATLAVYISSRIKQKRSAQGLGVQLIDIWGCLLVGMNLYSHLAARLSLLSPEQLALYVSIPQLFYMGAMPLMLMVTGILSGRAAPKWMTLGYIAIALTLIALPTTIEYPITQGTMTVALGSAINTTFLPGLACVLLGLVFRKRRVNGDA